MYFKAPNFRKMLMKFYPLGMELVMGMDNGLPTTTLVFVRNELEIDADTSAPSLQNLFLMGNLGDELCQSL